MAYLSEQALFLYRSLRTRWRLLDNYRLYDRFSNARSLLLIIAGHKPFLWRSVFSRVNAFCPPEVDVLIVSPGVYANQLSSICERHGWSYLSTFTNHVGISQNIAISLASNYEYIFKMDEDMFLTQDLLSRLLRLHTYLEKNGPFDVGFVAPLIPINGYGHYRLLSRLSLTHDYESRFGPCRPTSGTKSPTCFTKNPSIPLFFWRDATSIADIDALAHTLRSETISYSICPIRFSIGLILFKRDIIINMGYFHRTFGNGVSFDEIQLNSYCQTNSLACYVDETSVAGHLCYGPQTQGIIKYYLDNQDKFAAPHNHG